MSDLEHDSETPSPEVPKRTLVDFREYQLPIFNDRSPGVIVLHWARQIGKSYTLAAWAVDRLLREGKEGHLVTVLSNSRENGAEFILKCAQVCRIVGQKFQIEETSLKTPLAETHLEIRIKRKGQTGRIKEVPMIDAPIGIFTGSHTIDDDLASSSGINFFNGAWVGYQADVFNGLDPDDWIVDTADHSNTEVHVAAHVNPTSTIYLVANEFYDIKYTLSDPYTSDDLNDDVDFLLDKWDLADDIQYPFRTDADCTKGPLLTFFELAQTMMLQTPTAHPPEDFTSGTTTVDYGGGNSATFTFDPADSGEYEGYGPASVDYTGVIVDSNAQDGSVIGAPLPDGYDAYWDARHRNFEVLGGICSGVYNYGASSPYPHATQWSDDLDGACCPPGAFAAYNAFSIPGGFCGPGAPYYPGYLIKSKYAEVILLTQPSHNFARPCGEKDAETIDQDTIDTCAGPDSPCNLGALRWSDLTVPCATGAWNDNSVKGDWCLLTWTFNYRDVGENTRLRSVTNDPLTGQPVCEYDAGLDQLRPITGAWNAITCEQYCSTFLPCCPAVVYVTPNGEISDNSTTFSVPRLTCDETYGSLWQRIPQQWMTDPLWQPPVISEEACNAGKAWLEDDGSGLEDTDTEAYYPQRPWEEARCSLPSGAPALPDFCYIGALSTEDINDGVTVGNIIYAPAPGHCWNPWWSWAINRLNNTDGRFSCIYHDPMAVCDDDPEVEPP